MSDREPQSRPAEPPGNPGNPGNPGPPGTPRTSATLGASGHVRHGKGRVIATGQVLPRPALQAPATGPSPSSPASAAAPQGGTTGGDAASPQSQEQRRQQLGHQLLDAAESALQHQRQVAARVQAEQQALKQQVETARQGLEKAIAQQQSSLRQKLTGEQIAFQERLTGDMTASLRIYDQWVGRIEETVTQRLSALERKLTALQQRCEAIEQQLAEATHNPAATGQAGSSETALPTSGNHYPHPESGLDAPEPASQPAAAPNPPLYIHLMSMIGQVPTAADRTPTGEFAGENRRHGRTR